MIRLQWDKGRATARKHSTTFNFDEPAAPARLPPPDALTWASAAGVWVGTLGAVGVAVALAAEDVDHGAGPAVGIVACAVALAILEACAVFGRGAACAWIVGTLGIAGSAVFGLGAAAMFAFVGARAGVVLTLAAALAFLAAVGHVRWALRLQDDEG